MSDKQQQGDTENNSSSSDDEQSELRKGSQESVTLRRSERQAAKRRLKQIEAMRTLQASKKFAKSRPGSTSRGKRTSSLTKRRNPKTTCRAAMQTATRRVHGSTSGSTSGAAGTKQRETIGTRQAPKSYAKFRPGSTSHGKRTSPLRKQLRDLKAALHLQPDTFIDTEMAGMEMDVPGIMVAATEAPANNKEYEAVTEIVSQLEWDSFDGGEARRTIKKLKYKRVNVRVDIQGTFTNRNTGERYVNVQVQIKKKSVATLIVLANRNFGRQKIRAYLLRSLQKVDKVILYK